MSLMVCIILSILFQCQPEESCNSITISEFRALQRKEFSSTFCSLLDKSFRLRLLSVKPHEYPYECISQDFPKE